ncbi:MAG: RNA polymerase sigma factor [Myxococcota bacterium]
MANLLSSLATRLAQFAFRFVRNAQTAEDISQETLATAYNDLDRFEGRSRFTTWVFGIARNRCLARMRRRSELLVEDKVLDAHVDQARLGAYGMLRAKEREDIVLVAIDGLPAKEKDAFYMRYHLGLGRQEIQEVLGISEAVRNVLQRSRRRFEQRLRSLLDARGLTSSFLRLSSWDPQ